MFIYKNNKSRKTALIGMLVGLISVSLASLILNYVLITLEVWPLPGDIWNYILVGAVPFTAIKYLLNSVVVFLLYPRLSEILHK